MTDDKTSKTGAIDMTKTIYIKRNKKRLIADIVGI